MVDREKLFACCIRRMYNVKAVRGVMSQVISVVPLFSPCLEDMPSVKSFKNPNHAKFRYHW